VAVARLVVLAFALGCGGKARVKPVGVTHLAVIQIDGNVTISDGALRAGLALERVRATGSELDPHQLAVDTRRIRALYMRKGFFDAKVESRVIDDGRGRQTAIFTIEEGPRAKAQIVITGLPPEVSEEQARDTIRMIDGDPFDYAAYDRAKDPLVAMVEEAGYANVTMDAAVIADRDRGVATARYAIEPGPRARFGKVTVTGADPDLEDAIRGRLAFAEGETYARGPLVATQRALYELGRFSAVRVEPDRNGSAIVPVAIGVTLGTRHELRGGFGFGYEPLTIEARTFGGFSWIPENHLLWILGADARVAATVDHSFEDPQPKVRVLTTAQRLDFLRPRLIADLGVGFDYLTVEAYTSTGPQLRAGLTAPIGASWLQARLGWSFQYLGFSGISAVIDEPTREALGIHEPARIGVFQQAIVADLRDNPIDPRRGLYLSMRIAEGTTYAGSAFRYLQLVPELRGYVPVGSIVVAARLRGGAILGDVPITERFFSGGAQSQRGFSERSLAPTLVGVVDEMTASVPIGGAAFVETGVELRVPLGDLGGLPLGATIFLDGADVPADADDLDPANLHWAAGAGISIKLGGVKVRLDVGYRLNRRGAGEPRAGENTAFHIGVGDTF
jgi:translocation and assembly module TamA